MTKPARPLAALALAAPVLLLMVQHGSGAAPPMTVRAIAAPSTASPIPRSTASPTPRPVPSPTPLPVMLPPIYYRDGAAIYAVNPDGSNATEVATLPAGDTLQPQLLPDGRLLYPTGGGFAVIDRYGRRYGIRTPDLNRGETVWSVVPSPDGRALAWQLFAPAQLDGYSTNAGSARLVLTGRFGDAGVTVFSAQAGGADGQVPVLLGWRQSSPYSLGGPTLLLQDLYSQADGRAGVLPNTTRGLLEYDPAIGDLVDDYLPPLGTAVPSQRAFGISADGAWAVYGDSNVLTPSGEGPLARILDALNLDTNLVVRIDDASNYPSEARFVTTTVRKVGRRTVKRAVASALHLYHYFSHHAYMAPGNGRVLYTVLTVSYPPGALVPRVQQSVLVATIGVGSQRAPQIALVATDAQAEGWLSGRVAVIKRADGLYAVDVVFGGVTRLAAGPQAQLVGVR